MYHRRWSPPSGEDQTALTELWFSYPYPCPKKSYKLPAVLFCDTNCFTNWLGHGHGYDECHSSLTELWNWCGQSREFHELGFCHCLCNFCADLSSLQISAILVYHFTGNMTVSAPQISAILCKTSTNNAQIKIKILQHVGSSREFRTLWNSFMRRVPSNFPEMQTTSPITSRTNNNKYFRTYYGIKVLGRFRGPYHVYVLSTWWWVHVYGCMYVCVYIYIERERGRNIYIYIYIYIRALGRFCRPSRAETRRAPVQIIILILISMMILLLLIIMMLLHIIIVQCYDLAKYYCRGPSRPETRRSPLTSPCRRGRPGGRGQIIAYHE